MVLGHNGNVNLATYADLETGITCSLCLDGCFFGPQMIQVLAVITLISIIFVAGQIIVPRRVAVTHSRTIGALTSVIAGSIAAMICTDNSPAHSGFWYSLTILISGAIGVLAEHRSLHR